MGVLDHFAKFLSGFALLNVGIAYTYANPSTPIVIERKGDEFLLPPYLRDYDGGILNVVTERSFDQSNKRSVRPGEWLEYGDALSTPDRMGVYVQMNEGLQWVGGGVFEGKILDGQWKVNDPAYVVEMNRGWMKVWIKPSAFSSPLLVKTPKITINATEGVFWVSVSSLKTEVYVLAGTVRAGDQLCEANQFYEWSGTPAKLQKTSHEWDLTKLENQIGGLYPNLVKLSHRANEDWMKDISSKKYAELRSNGWKKADRYFPTPAPKK